MFNWKFSVIEQNPFDAKYHRATDPQAFYSWGISQVGSTWTTQSGFYYSDVMLLMKHFKVQNAAELIGKTFESERNEASTALDFLLVQIRHGGSYTPHLG